MKRRTTNKLFYRKWAYKVATSVLLGRVLSREIHNLNTPWDSETLLRQHSYQTRQDLLYYAEAMSELIRLPNVKLRREYDNYTYFTDSKTTADLITDKLKQFVTEVHEPASDTEAQFLLDNTKTVIVDRLPYEEFQYKVTLSRSMTADARQLLRNWIIHNRDKVKLFSSSEYFLFNDGWTYSPLIYVKDEKSLLMMRLFSGTHIKSVEKCILRSSINIES
jgi:hypothetical protein